MSGEPVALATAAELLTALDDLELVDPLGTLILPDGNLARDPFQLATRGTRVVGAAADGATWVLLRSVVPGPGVAVFSLSSGSLQDGALSRAETPAVWWTSAAVAPILVAGTYYAFALYLSPPDFNRGGDEALRERGVELSMVYTPLTGPDSSTTRTLSIVRPPIVAVHDMWSNCLGWRGAGLLEQPLAPGDPRGVFTTSCLDFNGALGLSGAESEVAVTQEIDEALFALRQGGVAATQVEVVAHGTGGILARRHIQRADYLRAGNLFQGDVNRLITMNTPHLGARMADEIVRFREFARARGRWSNPMNPSSGLNHLLKIVGLFLDPAEGFFAVDQLQTHSPLIHSLGSTPVPSHALVGTGARSISNRLARMLADRARLLYDMMQTDHPYTYLAPISISQTLVYGLSSIIFCPAAQSSPLEDHDLFATHWEQAGGLPAQAVTVFPVISGDPTSAHFATPGSAAYTARLVELLNTPVAGPSFAPELPATSEVPKLHSCRRLPF